MAILVLRNVKGTPLSNDEVDNNFSNLNSDINLTNSNIGVLANLTTSANSNIVVAINELQAEITSNVNITGGNIAGIHNLSVSGNIYASGNITAGGTISAPNIVSTGNIFGARFYGNVTAPADVTAANIVSTANVHGNYYFGNGSLLTGISVDSTRIISGNSAVTIVAANSNISANVGGTQVVLFGKDGASTANVSVFGNLTTTGNIVSNQNITGTLKAYKEAVTNLGNITSNTNLDLSLTNIFDVTVSANVTLTFTNPPAANTLQSATVILRQSPVGNRTAITFANAKYSEGLTPTLSAGANQVDVLTFFTVNGGAFWFGTHAMANVA